MKQEPKVLYTDPHIFIFDKPAGMPSVSLEEDEKDTLAAWILSKYPEQAKIGPGRLEAGLAHRLDNRTSGVILAARTDAAYENLRGQFNAGLVRKEYLALVLGDPPDEGKVDTPIAHHPRKKKKMIVCESESKAGDLKARPAVTKFKVIKRYTLCTAGGAAHYARVFIEITTGVRHQIRAHLASIGHPVAGDMLYMNPRKRAGDLPGLGRYLLHASVLKFRHPATGEDVKFTSPVPGDFERALASLTET